jgi:hypothetical protein
MPNPDHHHPGFTLTIGKRWENRQNLPCTDKWAVYPEKASKIRGFLRLSVDGSSMLFGALCKFFAVKRQAAPPEDSVDIFSAWATGEPKKFGGQRMSGLRIAFERR